MHLLRQSPLSTSKHFLIFLKKIAHRCSTSSLLHSFDFPVPTFSLAQTPMASPAAVAATKEVAKEIPAIIRLYKDGSVERLVGSPIVPPLPAGDPDTKVSSKDIKISQNPPISARIYLPNLTQPLQKLPILVYFHGGGFCIESAFSFLDQRYLTKIVAEAKILAVSVEYRLAPEHPLPIAYEDCWDALQWVASNSIKTSIDDREEPWLRNHGDFEKLFLGGDSAGANIVHNTAMRAGGESLHGGVKIHGSFLSHPYFWGSNPIGSEPIVDRDQSFSDLLWDLVYPSAPGGIDNPMINPAGVGAPSLARIGCSRVLVLVAGKDVLRDRGYWYCEKVKESGWGGEMEEMFEVEDEDHAFHLFNTETENAKRMIKRLASFLQK